MNTCLTCRHWRYDGYYTPRPFPKRDTWASGVCRMAEAHIGTADYPESKATAHDAEGYMAWLETLPDFGCNQHQPIGGSNA